MSVDVLQQMRTAFRAEALELLTELDAALLTLEAEPGNTGLVHRIFRAIHTIKGSGATAGFAHLAAVAHQVEEAFDLARSGRLTVTGELVECGLKACDVLHTILAAADPDAECPGEEAVLRAFSRFLPHKETRQGPDAASQRAPLVQTGKAAYRITVRPHRDLFYSGMDPIPLLDELRGLGRAHITAFTGDVPSFFDLEPQSCFLWWEIMLVTDHAESVIRDVFVFVADECDVSVRLLEDQTSAVAILGAIPAESLELFLIECAEHLETVEAHALELEQNNTSRASLDALFRAVHSVKGNAGLLLGQLHGPSLAANHPLRVLAQIAHAVESVLDPHRESGAGPIKAETVALVLEARDALKILLEGLRAQSSDGIVLPAHVIGQLGIQIGASEDRACDAGTAVFGHTALQCLELLDNCLQRVKKGEAERPLLKTYQRGLKTLAAAAAYQKRSDMEELASAQLRILDAAIRTSSLVSPEDVALLSSSLQSVRASIESAPPALEERLPVPAAPAVKQPPAVPSAASTIRIDQEKLDRLMRVVGELLVARGGIPTLVEKLSAGEDRAAVVRALKDAGAGISRIAEELQASVMAIRMLPVKTVFQRFPRLVRDLARSLGKEVHLVVEGDTIELDKTILEQIGDPLVHLVRNGVDHGLERPEIRQSQGKDPLGKLTLRAANEAGHVVIEVEDDGRGLDPEALKRKAFEKGLITADAAASMPATEAYQLVFLPGLSTADKVTDVSGRGVGMDVVLNNIRSLQGTVSIRSQPGSGTVFSIKLPTSLIISKGILLEAGGQEYILPLTAIRDMVKVAADKIHRYRGLRLTQIRGEVYQVVSLAETLGLPCKEMDELPIAVVDAGRTRYGLLADRFISEVEVLVKPLAGGLEHCREFHGAAIMGDGRVVLVLNPQACHNSEAAAIA